MSAVFVVNDNSTLHWSRGLACSYFETMLCGA